MSLPPRPSVASKQAPINESTSVSAPTSFATPNSNHDNPLGYHIRGNDPSDAESGVGAKGVNVNTSYIDALNNMGSSSGSNYYIAGGNMVKSDNINTDSHGFVYKSNPTLGDLAAQIQAKARAERASAAYNGDGNSIDYDDNDYDDMDDNDDDDEDEVAVVTGGSGTAICTPGNEQTGRWTRREHLLFLEALKKYGKEWKKVASMVKTRTVVQTRTHAQKYFQKMSKGGNMSGDDEFNISGEGLSSGEASGEKRSRKRSGNNTGKRNKSVADKSLNYEMIPTFSKASNTVSSDSYYDISQSEIDAVLGMNNVDSSHLKIHQTPTQNRIYGASMSIQLPPNPDDFPQPSPAACGKRKVAELVAAHILASHSRDDAEGIEVLSHLKNASYRPGEIIRRQNIVGVLDLSIINPDVLNASVDGNDAPPTPWESHIKALGVANDRARSLSFSVMPVSTPSEQKDFLSKIRDILNRGTPDDLEALLKAAEASFVSSTSSSSGNINDNINAESMVLAPVDENAEKKDSIKSEGIKNIAVSAQKKQTHVLAPTLNRTDKTRGTTVLMDACDLDPAMYSQKIVLQFVHILTLFGSSVSIADSNGNICLHRVAKSGHEKVGKLLLNRGSPVNALNKIGDAAIHIAAREGYGLFLEMLADFGANCHLRNNASRIALDLAGTTEKTIEVREELRRIMLSVEPRLRTLILYHEDCLDHTARHSMEWEGPDRLKEIMVKLQSLSLFPEHELEISHQFNKATVEMLGRVHSSNYIAFVDSLAKKVSQVTCNEPNIQHVPFTPQVQKFLNNESPDYEHIKNSDFNDTSFSVGTLQAARRAAGAVAHAVDRVLLGRNRNAFCVVRPPGHHAGYNGLLDGAKSCGFCIFNSVAAGALHALEEHNCERVALIDIDIHHGNGTEDIVRRYPHPSRLFFFSVHLYEKSDDRGYEFFPGSGSADDIAHNIINVPIHPMWHNGTTSPQNNSQGELTSNLVGREAYRNAISQRLIPSLRAFNPSLIIMSTGFDPASGDVGNLKNPSLGESFNNNIGMDLKEEDFAWVTSEILKVADICCSGRVVSVLEGGYGAYGPAPSAKNNNQDVFSTGRSTRNNNVPMTIGTSALVTEGNAILEMPTSNMNRSTLVGGATAHVRRLVDPHSNK